MKRLKRFMAFFLTLHVMGLNVSAAAGDNKLSNEFKSYSQVAGYVADRYIDDSITTEELIEIGISRYLEDNDEALVQMLKAMVSSLDDYSAFYTADEYKEFENSVNKTFYGIGIVMQQDGQYAVITGFAEENSKAEQSGFKTGDKIIKVNDVDVVGLSISEIRSKIIGDVNTTVNITVLRDNQKIELTGTRTEVKQNTVSYTALKNSIGYIKISSFGNNTATEFEEAIETFNKMNIKKIILDLRNNGGGLLSAAVDIGELIVPRGRIVEVKYRQSAYDVIYTSKKDNSDKEFVVLVNQNTASSAEILASAIQDSKVGVLLGTQTYGKAVVQSAYPLNNGSVFKITIGQYLTRNGNTINEVGLTPDYDVSNQRHPIDTTKYTKFDFKTKWAMGNKGTGVLAAKERLSMLGYYDGLTDNDIFYAELKDAVKLFQLTNGLAPYGVIDIPTQVKLEEAFEELELYEDNQLEEAYKLLGGNVEDLYN